MILHYIDTHKQVHGACVRRKRPSRRQVRDEELKTGITCVHRENYAVCGTHGAWRCRLADIAVARRTVDRLMDELGLPGTRRGKPNTPNTLWVADFTYGSTWSGWMYVAFVIDADARRIVGWRTATGMTAQLVLDAIEHAIWTRSRNGSSKPASMPRSAPPTTRRAGIGIDRPRHPGLRGGHPCSRPSNVATAALA